MRRKDKRLCLYLPDHIYEYLQTRSVNERRGWISELVISLLEAEMGKDYSSKKADIVQTKIEEALSVKQVSDQSDDVRKQQQKAKQQADKDKAEDYLRQAKTDPENALGLALLAYKLGIGLKRLKMELPEVYPALRDMVRRLRI